jgi:predicted flap endonuclease-1-like 5' DNA nuclease
MSTPPPHPNADAFPTGMSQPSLRALAGIGVTRLDQVPAYAERELAVLHGMGAKGIRLLREALEAQGKTFRAA